MSSTAILILILAAAVIVVVTVRIWFRNRVFDRAAQMAKEVFPVWAAQGPFRDGLESALAMRHAWLAVFGDFDKVATMTDTFRKHQEAFDSNPAVWERNRAMALDKDDDMLPKYLDEVQRLRALEERQATLVEEIREIAEYPELAWSSSPKAYEAQLIRRYKNPYFPPPYRTVSAKDVAEARKIDQADYALAQERFFQTGTKIQSLQSTMSVSEFHELRERLDDVILFSLGVGGPASEIAEQAESLRSSLIADIRAAFHHDTETLAVIEQAERFHEDEIVGKFHFPVLAQMLRDRSPILKEHTVATILSEDPRTIAAAMKIFSEETQAVFRLEGMTILKEALGSGHVDPQIREKIAALEGAPMLD